MRFDEIVKLLEQNTKISDWARVELPDGIVSYCLADVNLHTELRKSTLPSGPTFTFSLKYASSVLIWVAFEASSEVQSHLRYLLELSPGAHMTVLRLATMELSDTQS